jgi:hypothetical protein
MRLTMGDGTKPPAGDTAPDDRTIALAGTATIRSGAAGDLTSRPDMPPPPRTEVDASIFATWSPPPRTPTFVINGGPASPPFPPGEYTIQGNDVDLIVTRARMTAIGHAVATNHVAIQLAAVSLLNALNAKLAALHDERSNSEDAGPYQDLKRLIEAFLAAQTENDEKPIVESTISFAEGLSRWWTEDHLSICNKAINMGLFTGGMTIRYLAGALGPISVATIGALVGGKDVVSALESCVKILVKRD